MRAVRSWFALLGTLALADMPAPAGAQAVGAEFQINTYTTQAQQTWRRSIAADASGNFIVVWTSQQGQDGSQSGVFGQRYDGAGQRRGAEFRINSFTTSNQGAPSVASAANGNFVVVWQGDGRGDGDGIFGQRYDSEGLPQGREFRVNSYTTDPQEYPSVASDASGNFVVVWECNDGYRACGSFGQRFDNQGMPQGGEFQIGVGTSVSVPSVASDASGNFVVVWDDFGPGDYVGIVGRRYDNKGMPRGGEFKVDSYPQGLLGNPTVASDAAGNFVVVWESFLQDGDWFGVFGQRFDSAGVAQGDEFQVNSYTTQSQMDPNVALDANGSFTVVWASYRQDGYSFGVFGQRYDREGVAQGDEFQINTYTPFVQRFPSVGATGPGQFVVAWLSYNQDGSLAGVFGQRFNFGSVTVVSPNTNVKWRIGSQHRIQWTHKLGAGQTFRIELDRDNDGNYEEVIAAAAPSSATRGSFAWTVTGPPSGTARVRVSWTDDPSISDASDVTFQIRP